MIDSVNLSVWHFLLHFLEKTAEMEVLYLGEIRNVTTFPGGIIFSWEAVQCIK